MSKTLKKLPANFRTKQQGEKIVGVHDQCMVEERLMSMKRIETNITSLQYLKTVSIHQEFRLRYNTKNKYLFQLFYTNDEDYSLL